jgi:hypothetical protein
MTPELINLVEDRCLAQIRGHGGKLIFAAAT